MTYVSYRGAAQAMPDLMADQIQLTVTPLASALPLAREGRIKLLAVTTPERSAAAPDLMTAAEAGHPELTVEAPLGLFGPNTIPLVVARPHRSRCGSSCKRSGRAAAPERARNDRPGQHTRRICRNPC